MNNNNEFKNMLNILLSLIIISGEYPDKPKFIKYFLSKYNCIKLGFLLLLFIIKGYNIINCLFMLIMVYNINYKIDYYMNKYIKDYKDFH